MELLKKLQKKLPEEMGLFFIRFMPDKRCVCV